jgi:hypothetical protein
MEWFFRAMFWQGMPLSFKQTESTHADLERFKGWKVKWLQSSSLSQT